MPMRVAVARPPLHYPACQSTGSVWRCVGHNQHGIRACCATWCCSLGPLESADEAPLQRVVPPVLARAVITDGIVTRSVRQARGELNEKPVRGRKPMDASDSYTAADIEVLEGLEPVRRRPGMYIGGTDEKAMHHLFAEVIDNSMDEAVAGHATWIEVRLEADGFLTVTDNGRGIPVDPHPKFKTKSALEVIMTMLHSGGKFDCKVYNTSGGLHGVGVSVVNALSETLEVEVARGQQLYPMVVLPRRAGRQAAEARLRS